MLIAFIITASTFDVSTDTQGSLTHAFIQLSDHDCGRSGSLCSLYEMVENPEDGPNPGEYSPTWPYRLRSVRACEAWVWQKYYEALCDAYSVYGACREKAIQDCLDNINRGYSSFASAVFGAIQGVGIQGRLVGMVGYGATGYILPSAWCRFFDGQVKEDARVCEAERRQAMHDARAERIEDMNRIREGQTDGRPLGIGLSNGICDACENGPWAHLL